jgi:hypothetical protein
MKTKVSIREGYSLHKNSSFEEQINVIIDDFDFKRVSQIKKFLRDAYPMETVHKEASVDHLKKTARNLLNITATVSNGPNYNEGFEAAIDFGSGFAFLTLKFVVDEISAEDGVDFDA